ncbi:MAG TPA: hypothetical protein VHC42_07425 [Rhizomicrobium sp.]|nr:hypothetical protein [Rhizomicrobium sp.]
MRRIALVAGIAALWIAPALAAGLPQPYKKNVTNFAYNLLFCDTPALFAQNASLPHASPLYRVLHASAKDGGEIRRIADDSKTDSCTRMLAYDWLRARKLPVPKKTLLGVVVELGSRDSLDVVAVYPDGAIRFIDEKENLHSFGSGDAAISAKGRELLARSAGLLAHLDPWKEQRVIAPPMGIVRITFLASSGLYFGDGEIRQMARDKFGGAAIRSAVDLFKLVDKATTGP